MKDAEEISMKKKHNLIDLLTSNNKTIVIPKTYSKQYVKRAINKDIDIRAEFDLNEHDKKQVSDYDTLNHIYRNLLVYKDKNNLYGRHWGAKYDIDSLHFECCYYQGIEFAIKNTLITGPVRGIICVGKNLLIYFWRRALVANY